MIYDVLIDGKKYRLQLERAEAGWVCHLNDSPVRLDAVLSRPEVLSILIDGKPHEVKRERSANGEVHLWIGPSRYAVEVNDPRGLARKRLAGDERGPRRLVAPMPGKVLRILVSEKAEVEAGQGILVVEAMKMQNEIKAPKKGIVRKLMVVEGAAVNAGDILAIVE